MARTVGVVFGLSILFTYCRRTGCWTNFSTAHSIKCTMSTELLPNTLILAWGINGKVHRKQLFPTIFFGVSSIHEARIWNLGKLITLLGVVLSQLMIGFLLNNNQASIGSSVISTRSLADLFEQRVRNVPIRFSRRSWGRKIAWRAQRMSA